MLLQAPVTTRRMGHGVIPTAHPLFAPLPVGYDLWADADVGQASDYMQRLVDDPGWGRELGRRATRMVRSRVSYRTVGMAYRRRMDAIWTGRAG